jgi:hypothetical protein
LAVQAYVAEVDKRGANQAWSVIANRNGLRNKVAFRADGRPTAGWYCYIVR